MMVTLSMEMVVLVVVRVRRVEIELFRPHYESYVMTATQTILMVVSRVNQNIVVTEQCKLLCEKYVMTRIPTMVMAAIVCAKKNFVVMAQSIIMDLNHVMMVILLHEMAVIKNVS